MKTFDHLSGAYISIGDARIYYERRGHAAGPPLVLLHGGFGSMEDFNALLPAIDPSYNIVAIDSRGQGKSTLGSEGLSYERLQHDVEAVLRQLQVQEASILGISDGGIVAYRLAAYSGLTINKLATIGARWHRDNVAATYELLSGTTAASWKKKFPQTVELYERLNPEANFDLLAGKVVGMWLTEASYPGDDVKDIKAETLIIRGDKDPLTKRQFVARLADLVPNAHLSNVAFAGHEVYREQKEVLLQLLRQFLPGTSDNS